MGAVRYHSVSVPFAAMVRRQLHSAMLRILAAERTRVRFGWHSLIARIVACLLCGSSPCVSSTCLARAVASD